MQQVNPDDYVISRRRKKYKFAKFLNASNCFECSEWPKQQVDIVEMGAGTGMFAVELATRHPDKKIVAVDVKADRLQKGAYLALERGIDNIQFVRARVDQADELFDTSSIEQIWVTFPDPFPKSRKGGRRMTHPSFLKKYAALLAENGALYLKHDNTDFFHWSLEQLVAEKWRIDELSFDLHDSDLSDDYKVMTTYEKRWLGEGLKTNFLKAEKAR